MSEYSSTANDKEVSFKEDKLIKPVLVLLHDNKNKLQLINKLNSCVLKLNLHINIDSIKLMHEIHVVQSIKCKTFPVNSRKISYYLSLY